MAIRRPDLAVAVLDTAGMDPDMFSVLARQWDGMPRWHEVMGCHGGTRLRCQRTSRMGGNKGRGLLMAVRQAEFHPCDTLHGVISE
ncbi:unnamed protein product [Urochloa humidicola]